jgi:hypothetical protein
MWFKTKLSTFCHQINSFTTWPLITNAIVSQYLQIMEHKNQQQNKRRQKNILLCCIATKKKTKQWHMWV